MKPREKIKELKQMLREYESISPTSLANFSNDLRQKAAGERYFEKIVECTVDLAIIAIKQLDLRIPENDTQAFETLAKHKAISEETAYAMQHAKSMRNLIVHQYGNVDDKKVYTALTKELPRDAAKFIKEIEKVFEK
ncbi:MAG: DUF86 domain-containing protein [Candidatus Micrarchaeota archaeon]